MDTQDREHLLQKVVAVSGFVFALLILPVAQYVLVHGGQQPAEQGTVAGDTTITNADLPSDPAACTAKKSQDLKDLQAWQDNRLAALDRDYKTAVDPYKAAIPVVTGDVVKEQASLQSLIDDETRKYTAKKTAITTAVDKQITALSAQNCGPVASPTAIP
jgi:hypothetical protein